MSYRCHRTIPGLNNSLGDGKPIKQAVRRMAFARRLVEEMLAEMLAAYLVEPDYVLVKNVIGYSFRFCVNYCKFNAVTRKDAHLIPRIDETFDSLANSLWFTTLDLVSRHFIPFELCNAPATFQRLMESVLSGLLCKVYLVYLDDIIILENSEEEHLKNLKKLQKRLRGTGFKIKFSECPTGDLPGVRHDPWQSDDKPTENCSRGTMFSFPLHLRSTTIFGSQPLLSPFHSRLCKDSESTARADVEEPALQVEGQARSRHCLTEKPSDFSTTAETPSLH
ncbi:Retrovirus-related Pol polyprotein from transposon 17.6 [Trichinella papuae]|uniref:Retrovirus-related Pol polyprotein from transposon 17.6 n=1 Tax=Trichinella papuae TaxID=268474 RepID=A0A0V1M149_9BILA|nr:Retrovirus-related Pol polyprotein from transposon 17.6 [Trichinella papuae]